MTDSSFEQIVQMQEENYKNRIGLRFGIFEVKDVEYDWGLKRQIWTVKCTVCGAETRTANGRDWARGKGRSLKTCPNCKKIEEKKKREHQERMQKIQAKARVAERESFIGLELGGWKVKEALENGKYLAECMKCGNQKQVTKKEISIGSTPKCRHPDKTPIFVGQRFGNLTVLDISGKSIKVRCDCGREKQVVKHSLIKGITITCAHSNCPYRRKLQATSGRTYAVRGREFEEEYCEWLNKQGFKAEVTKQSGDYGVDIIVTRKNGEKTAVQLKYHKSKNSLEGVSAVQQVYAGGKYYDCTNFVVVSSSGFTYQAINMAKKLGVYLSAFDLKGHAFACGGNRIVYEVGGVKRTSQELCKEAGISRETLKNRLNRGMPIEEAIKPKPTGEIVEINGERHTVGEWCRRLGLSTAFVKYRMDVKKMDAYTALTAEKIVEGRPKKASS